jgi:hypothetical protein
MRPKVKVTSTNTSISPTARWMAQVMQEYLDSLKDKPTINWYPVAVDDSAGTFDNSQPCLVPFTVTWTYNYGEGVPDAT